MTRAALVAGALLLAGCIPQVEPPYRDDAPPREQPYSDVQRVQRVPPEYAPHRRRPPPAVRSQPTSDELTTDENAGQSSPGTSAPQPIGTGVSALPAPPPAWEAKTVVTDARDVSASAYVVRPGDTLGAIANRTGAAADVIARANDLDPPFVVAAGQRLRIPAGRYHLVRQGQTGIAIARAYGVEWSKIVAANALAEPYILRTGQRILIPGFEPGARPRSYAERAAAFQLDVDDILTGGEPALASNAEPVAPVVTPKRVLPSTAVVIEPTRRNGAFLWPVRGDIVGRFGPVRAGERNDGIQIAVPVDTPIRAAADGVIAYVGDGVASLGGLVIIKHGDGWTTVYGHASQLLVQRGQAVKRGQVIARSGDTGYADRPELHFEIRKGRTPVDPLAQLPNT